MPWAPKMGWSSSLDKYSPFHHPFGVSELAPDARERDKSLICSWATHRWSLHTPSECLRFFNCEWSIPKGRFICDRLPSILFSLAGLEFLNTRWNLWRWQQVKKVRKAVWRVEMRVGQEQCREGRCSSQNACSSYFTWRESWRNNGCDGSRGLQGCRTTYLTMAGEQLQLGVGQLLLGK